MFSSQPFLRLIEMVLVITTVIASLMLCTHWFKEALLKRFTIKIRIILVLVFGAISIYGTYSGIDIHGGIINIRDLGPIVGGIVGGPLIGLGAGLIGGLHRYYLGGFTAFPCAIATIFAGVFGGMAYRMKKGNLINMNEALILVVLVESFHMILVLLFAQPFSEALAVVKEVIAPMIISNAFGLIIFVLMFSHQVKELKKAEDVERHIILSKEVNS